MKTRAILCAIVVLAVSVSSVQAVDFVTFVDDYGYYAPVSAWTDGGWVPFTVQSVSENHLVVWTSPVGAWPGAVDVVGGVRVGAPQWMVGPLLWQHREVGQVDGWAVHYTQENEGDYGSYFALLYPPGFPYTYGLGVEAIAGVWTVGQGFTALADVPEPASLGVLLVGCGLVLCYRGRLA